MKKKGLIGGIVFCLAIASLPFFPPVRDRLVIFLFSKLSKEERVKLAAEAFSIPKISTRSPELFLATSQAVASKVPKAEELRFERALKAMAASSVQSLAQVADITNNPPKTYEGMTYLDVIAAGEIAMDACRSKNQCPGILKDFIN